MRAIAQQQKEPHQPLTGARGCMAGMGFASSRISEKSMAAASFQFQSATFGNKNLRKSISNLACSFSYGITNRLKENAADADISCCVVVAVQGHYPYTKTT